VLGQLVDARREQRDLHLGRAGVGLALAVLADDLLFGFLAEGHRTSFTTNPQSPPLTRKLA
jgi:hypothetical protein